MSGFRDKAGMPYLRTPKVQVKNREFPQDPDWVQNMLTSFVAAIGDMASLVEDRTHRVDETSTQSLNATVTSLQWQAEYDLYDEVIESVIVTGPVSSTFTLQLGKRYWNVATDAQGKFIAAPVSFRMKRGDVRQLTAATPGAWTCELMGYADMGYKFK